MLLGPITVIDDVERLPRWFNIVSVVPTLHALQHGSMEDKIKEVYRTIKNSKFKRTVLRATCFIWNVQQLFLSLS